MRPIETTITWSQENSHGILWKRVVLAAFLSEAGVVAVLSTIIAIYAMTSVPGQTDAQSQEFAELAGYYVAAPAAALTTFLFALWAVRKLASHFIANGALVGVVATVLTVGFLFGAKPEHRVMYVISFVARIAAGYTAGLVAQRRKGAAA
jgi:hypothetical protein